MLLPQETVIFAVTQDRFEMAVMPVRRASLAERVHRIRRAIDKVAIGESVLFLRDIDADLLHGLYTDLVAPVAAMLAGKQKVFVVADGPLHTIPFELMVPRYGVKERAAFELRRAASDGSSANPWLAEYASLEYLGRNMRFAYLPSLAALASQRLYPKRAGVASVDLVAFADPVFVPSAGRAMTGQTLTALTSLNIGFARGADGAPVIPRLAETAEEAREIAGVLGGSNRLYIGERAQERTVKNGDLRSARFVLFATHGFLGGEFVASDQPIEEGELRRAAPRGQPALALTLVGDLLGEDGLLTMKEVIEDLELDADLVALSACNTAGDTVEASNGEASRGSRALSCTRARAACWCRTGRSTAFRPRLS